MKEHASRTAEAYRLAQALACRKLCSLHAVLVLPLAESYGGPTDSGQRSAVNKKSRSPAGCVGKSKDNKRSGPLRQAGLWCAVLVPPHVLRAVSHPNQADLTLQGFSDCVPDKVTGTKKPNPQASGAAVSPESSQIVLFLFVLQL